MSIVCSLYPAYGCVDATRFSFVMYRPLTFESGLMANKQLRTGLDSMQLESSRKVRNPVVCH